MELGSPAVLHWCSRGGTGTQETLPTRLMRYELLGLLSGSLECLPYLLRVNLLAFQSGQAEGRRSVPLGATLVPLQELLGCASDIVAGIADTDQLGLHEYRRGRTRGLP